MMFTLIKPKISDSTKSYITNMEEYMRLSASTLRTLEKLWKYKVPEDIIKRLKKNFPYNMMTNEETNVCIDEFKKYMAIMVIGHSKGRGVAMTSPVIDEIWHQLILFTVEYHKFSNLLDKEYIHHTPNTKSFKFGPDAVSFFYDTYKKYFGDLHSIWIFTVIEEKLDFPPEKTTNLASAPLLADNQGGKEINYGGLVYASKYRIGKKTLQKNTLNAKVSGIAQGESKSQSSSCGGMFYCGMYTSGYGASDSGAISENPVVNYGDVGGIGSDFSNGADGDRDAGGDSGCGGCGGCG